MPVDFRTFEPSPPSYPWPILGRSSPLSPLRYNVGIVYITVILFVFSVGFYIGVYY